MHFSTFKTSALNLRAAIFFGRLRMQVVPTKNKEVSERRSEVSIILVSENQGKGCFF
jgi:hypothetical protein